MRDLNLNTPEVGDRVSREYLQGVEHLAGHNHSMTEGLASRYDSASLPPAETAGAKIYTCTLTANLLPGSSAAATLLEGAAKDETGDAIVVKDIPTSISTDMMIASDTVCRVWKDHDVTLAANEYVLLIPFTCEADQPA